MAKAKTRYVCQECGRTVPKALGRCPQCGAWDSMVEEIVVDESKSALSQVLPGLGGFQRPNASTKLMETAKNASRCRSRNFLVCWAAVSYPVPSY